jgi:putative restriction endonuclease
MAERTYGEVPGYPVGSTFVNRAQLAASRVHRPNQAGICGGKDGAESIVVSGGYIDDEDYGDEIVYTGQGGNDPSTKRQVADQVLELGNAGLARNQLEGYAVRVVRGSGGDPAWSPATGLRYDGLLRVVDHWHTVGKDGFRIWRFRLVGLENSDQPPIDEAPVGASPRIPAVIQRLVRSTAVAVRVKQMHDHRCQICGLQIVTPAGPYAEAAYIRALGRPHHGPDVLGNVLCLCPNHHVMLDAGAVYIDNDHAVRETVTGTALGRLRMVRDHLIEGEFLAYHREVHAS